MFNADTCKLCGTCLTKCPFLSLPREEARREIALLVKGQGRKETILNCAGCGYCSVICPTQSNPSRIRREMRLKKSGEKGASMIALISEDVPTNLMTIGLEFEKQKKQRKLEQYAAAPPGREVFYLGCSLSYIYTDLADTSLLNSLPVIGGMEYCCGAYVRTQFNDEEIAIKGRQLLKKLKQKGIRSLVTFCPECEDMIDRVYPELIPEFDIRTRSVVNYFLDRHDTGKIRFQHPIRKKVTVHDACASRSMDTEAHDDIRGLLQLLGAEVAEMKHNKANTMCCGAPLSVRNPMLAAGVAEKRALEARETGAEMMVVGCTGCFNLSDQVSKQGLEIFHILELLQTAIGEQPAHRIDIIRTELAKSMIAIFSENPEIIKQRYTIKNGKVIAV